MKSCMRRWRASKVNGHTIRVLSASDHSHRARITARSEKHAERLASELNWQTMEGGVGRPFSRLNYIPNRNRLEVVLGYDI